MLLVLQRLNNFHKICLHAKNYQNAIITYSLTRKSSNDAKDVPKPSSKTAIPKEFSKLSSYPTRLSIHQASVQPGDYVPSQRARIISMTMAAGVMIFIIYAIFFSTYNLEIEENLCNQMPGYKESMIKQDPQYEEKLNKLREQKYRKAH